MSAQQDWLDRVDEWARGVIDCGDVHVVNQHGHEHSSERLAQHILISVDTVETADKTLNTIAFGFETVLRLLGDFDTPPGGTRGFVDRLGGDAFQDETMALYQDLGDLVTSKVNKHRLRMFIDCSVRMVDEYRAKRDHVGGVEDDD